jgi:MFS transporter, Spinster family, sphingosine-1-phosphate transporter
MSKIASAPDVVKKKSRSWLPGYSRHVFVVLFGISFLNYMDRFVLTGASNSVAKELGFNLDGIGSISSAFLIVYTICTIPLGLWADHTKRKNVVAFCVTIWSCATALTALATNFTTLFLSRMILGIGEAGYFPAGTALLSDYVPRSRRSRVMTFWGTTQFFGVLAGYAIGGFAAGKFLGSWRLAFVFTGVPGLILALLIWRVREPRRNQADELEIQEEQSTQSNGSAISSSIMLADSLNETYLVESIPLPGENDVEIAETLTSSIDSRDRRTRLNDTITITKKVLLQCISLLRIKTLSALIIMQIFAFFVLAVNVTFLPIYLQQTDTFNAPRISQQSAGLISGVIIVLAGLTGALLGGYFAEVLGRRYAGARVLVCGIGFLLSAPLFALAVIFHQIVLFLVLFYLTASLITVHSGPSTAATQDVVPSRLRASAVAISLLIAHLFGDAFAPFLVGVLATAFDPTHGMHFQHGLAGQDLSMALLFTCPIALFLAGLAALFGARWMKHDVASAVQADQLR